MARDFDGVNDNLNFGSDTSVDDFSQQSIAMWINDNAAGNYRCFLAKHRSADDWEFFCDSSNRLTWQRSWQTINNGGWHVTSPTISGLTHIALAYDTGDVTNDPDMYIDGTLATETEFATPVGSPTSDATNNLFAGETGTGSDDFTGQMQNVIYYSGFLSAADVNRHRWYGSAPGGPSTVEVLQPLLTTDLTNKGTATANGSATGTTMASLPRTERMYAGMMGVGR